MPGLSRRLRCGRTPSGRARHFRPRSVRVRLQQIRRCSLSSRLRLIRAFSWQDLLLCAAPLPVDSAREYRFRKKIIVERLERKLALDAPVPCGVSPQPGSPSVVPGLRSFRCAVISLREGYDVSRTQGFFSRTPLASPFPVLPFAPCLTTFGRPRG
jgi:hypothetical protein